MGIGVFRMRHGATVIIDHESVYGEWDVAHPHGYADIAHEEDSRFLYRDFIAQLMECLPPTYRAVGNRWRERDTVIIAENAFYQLCVTDQACDFHVSVALRDGFNTTDGHHPLARVRHPEVALAFFVRLARRYPLRVRTSGWTSAPYDPSAATAA